MIAQSDWQAGKELRARIVAMLTRMMGPPEHVREPETVYGYAYEYGYGAHHRPNKPLQPTRACGPRG